MKGKTCLITGATSGIGLVAAEELARRGAALILVGRDSGRAAAALDRIKSRVPAAQVALRIADLSRLAEIRRLAADLLAKIREAAPARIVNVASAAHLGATLDFSDLTGRRDAKGWPAYRCSKLANILFTAELARRLEGSGVTANCLHPGFVATRFGDAGNTLATRAFLGLAKRVTAITPEEGARTIVHLVSAPEVAGVSGRYFVKSREAQPSPAAQDAVAARRLWEESARIAGIAG